MRKRNVHAKNGTRQDHDGRKENEKHGLKRVDAVFDERDVIPAAVERFLPNKRECDYYSLKIKI